MQAGRDPAHRRLGQLAAEGVDEGCSSRGVAEPHPPPVPVKMSAGQELRERELLNPRLCRGRTGASRTAPRAAAPARRASPSRNAGASVLAVEPA